MNDLALTDPTGKTAPQERAEMAVATHEPSNLDVVERPQFFTTTKEQREILNRPIADNEIEIRPDGLLYPGWYWVANRLDEAFGQGAWRLIPDLRKEAMIRENNLVCVHCKLEILGVLVNEAWGENRYNPKNAMMSLGDAIEGAKSNALMRCSKFLVKGMRRLWSNSENEAWKKEYAESKEVVQNGKKKTIWRKKPMPKTGDQVGENPAAGQQNGGATASSEPNMTPTTRKPMKADSEASQEAEPENTTLFRVIAEGPEILDEQSKAILDGFKRLRSGNSLMKWVKDNIELLMRAPGQVVNDLNAKWETLQEKGQIDKDLKLAAWVKKSLGQNVDKNGEPTKSGTNKSANDETADTTVPPEVKEVADSFDGQVIPDSAFLRVADDAPKSVRYFAQLANKAIQNRYPSNNKLDGKSLMVWIGRQVKSKGKAKDETDFMDKIASKPALFKSMWEAFEKDIAEFYK